MANLSVIILAVIVFMVLLLTGHYISTVLFGASMLGLYILGGNSMSVLSGHLINDPYVNAASYTLSTVPMFTLMAQFIMRSGIIRDCYAVVFRASQGKKGSLGIMTILLGGFLGAVSGSATATAASLGQIAVPELRSRGYSEHLSGAVAACAGSLSAVIPPSLMLIIYGSIAQVSVGKLFMATLIPGIIIMGIFAVMTVYFLTTKKEKELAEGQNVKGVELEITRGRMIFVVCIGIAIMAIIFVGIYTGTFTPTESGAIGAFLGLITTFVTRTFNFKVLRDSLVDTVKVTGMSATIILAASFFSRFVTRSLMARMLMQSLSFLIERPTLLIIVLGIIYYLLYMFLDGSAVVLMTVPILLPILDAAGIDLIWFGIFICTLCTLGSLTPPVGMSVYATSGASGIGLGKIFHYAFIYATAATILIVILMLAFPQIVLWLPGTM
ncbi:MAG: TRAP transporter large permease [Lachnospiraceae bacterium]|nr:TRAP transporter large permease [Lachnospiraceae bacterium]